MLFDAPVVVAAFFPFVEVTDFEVFAGVAELFDDGLVGESVLEEVVDLIADSFGEAGDGAFSAGFG